MPTAPCTPYITHAELLECCNLGSDASPEDEDSSFISREVASSYLFYATGQQFPGICDVFVRPQFECTPCQNGALWEPRLIEGRWLNLRCGQECICSDTRCGISLRNWDVQSVVDVYIDGFPVDHGQWFFNNGKVYLREGCWPDCNRWDKPAFPGYDSEISTVGEESEFEGTFGIHIMAGVDTPALVKQATKELACHYQNMCESGCNHCDVAIGLSDKGTIDYALNEVIPWIYTGIFSVDAAARMYNPHGSVKVQARFWSPEADRAIVEYPDGF